MNPSRSIIAKERRSVKPLSWEQVADFREQLYLLELSQALEVLEILRKQITRRVSAKETDRC